MAHEFLHSLNQLERIDLYWFIFNFEPQNTDIFVVLETAIPMENFLTEKLGISNDSIIFQKTYSELWGNKHFLDEMTVILGSERRIGEVEFVFIGETTFLREYFQDNTIISWSHDSARNINFWQKMSAILQKNYVNVVLKNNQFGLDKLNVQRFEIDEKQKRKKENLKYIVPESFGAYKQEAQDKINNNIVAKISIENQVTHQCQVFESLKTKQGLPLLPRYYTSFVLDGYQLVDLFDDANIIFEELVFEKFKNFLNEDCGVLLKTDMENQAQYYEYKPLKKRHYFSLMKQTTCDIVERIGYEKIYYYNGVKFQKLQKLDN